MLEETERFRLRPRLHLPLTPPRSRRMSDKLPARVTYRKPQQLFPLINTTFPRDAVSDEPITTRILE